MAGEKYTPKESNLGKECSFWIDARTRLLLGEDAIKGCIFPKHELTGRMSCEGIIDDVCLLLKDGRRANSLTEEQVRAIRTTIPGTPEWVLPPGDTE